MTVSSLEEKIQEMQENAQEATQALQAAQQRVVELQALLQRQTGALTALAWGPLPALSTLHGRWQR